VREQSTDVNEALLPADAADLADETAFVSRYTDPCMTLATPSGWCYMVRRWHLRRPATGDVGRYTDSDVSRGVLHEPGYSELGCLST
jgi:hypothetical protein